jgi:hypothetical protein
MRARFVGYLGMLACSEDQALRMEAVERAGYLQRLEPIAVRMRLHTKHVTVAADWEYRASEVSRGLTYCLGT